MNSSQKYELEEEDDDDDDEPVWWDVLEENYGRPLTEEELIQEIKSSYQREFLELSDEELQEDLQRQRDWMLYKRENAVKLDALISKKLASKTAAEDLWFSFLSPPIDDDGEMPEGGYDQWINQVNSIIKEKIDFHAMIEIFRLAGESALRRQASEKATKRHSENHALRDEIYAWLDSNLGVWTSLNDAAMKMAMKVVPLKYEAVRRHCTEWNRLRKEGML